MEFKLVLVRHGETEHNAGSVIQGQLDIPLSTTGISQSKLLSRVLSNIEWREVWTSDLKRAWQTANFALNKKPETADEESLLSRPFPPINTDVRLRERNYGEAQGQSLANLQKLAGNSLVTDFIPRGAESPEEVRQRVISFFQDLCSRLYAESSKDPISSSSPSILMIGHGGWLREFMTYLTFLAGRTGSSCAIAPEIDVRKVAGRICPNTAVSRFQISLGSDGAVSGIQCLSLHDRSHLDSNAILCEEMAV